MTQSLARPGLPNCPLRWVGRPENGDLLTAAESAEFDAFLTLDQGIEYQQNLIGRKIAIVVFRAKSSRLKDLLPLIPACLTALESIQAGQLVEIESNGR